MAWLAGMEGPEYELGHRMVEKELLQRENILGQVWAFRTRLNPCSVKGLSLLAGPPSCGSLKGQTNISQEREGSHRETIISFCCPRQFLRTDAGLRAAVDSLSEDG